MRFIRKKRGLAAVSVLAALLGVTLWIVLPAFAATATGYNGQTSQPGNITPTYLNTGGQNNCGLFGSKIGTDQYFVTNPKAIAGKPQTVTASNGAKVTFTVNVDKSYTYLSFSVSGAIVTDVGIKGGNGTDWYNYETNPVTQDGATAGLTAPAQTANGVAPFYSLSQTVFCFTPKIFCAANTPLSDPSNPGETIELPSCDGKSNVYFDFNSGTTADNRNFVSVYAHGSGPQTPMVERVAGTLSGSTQPVLQYSDTDPAGPLHDMRLCQVDPRAGGADPLALAAAYQALSTSTSVLATPDTTNDPENTSCLISDRTWVDAAKVVHFEAYVYTIIDGQRVF